MEPKNLNKSVIQQIMDGLFKNTKILTCFWFIEQESSCFFEIPWASESGCGPANHPRTIWHHSSPLNTLNNSQHPTFSYTPNIIWRASESAISKRWQPPGLVHAVPSYVACCWLFLTAWPTNWFGVEFNKSQQLILCFLTSLTLSDVKLM